MMDDQTINLSRLPIIPSIDCTLVSVPGNKYIKECATTTPPDKRSGLELIDMNDRDHDTYIPSSASSFFNRSGAVGLTGSRTFAGSAVRPTLDTDAMCKWDMSLFNFPIATRLNTVGRFPWVGNPSLAWQIVLQVLNTRYPAKPFYPKDPRVSKSIWAVSVVQKNRASCNKIILNVGALYAKSQRVVAQQHSASDADELINLMNTISVRDSGKTTKFPWVSRNDPTWGDIIMALDILFATNPGSNIGDTELRMNYIRVSRYAVALVRRDKPWLSPEQAARHVTLLHPFLMLRVALTTPSVEFCRTGKCLKRKQKAMFKDTDDEDNGTDADIEDCDDDDDDETDDEDVAIYNQRLKRARVD